MGLRKDIFLALTVVLLSIAAPVVVAACGNGGSGSGGAYGGGGGGAVIPTESPSSPSGAGGGERQAVTIKDFSYSPATLTIDAGTTMVWTNEDSVGHTVTSADGIEVGAAITDVFDSGILNQGDTFEFTFDEPGTYYYLCRPHASMASMHAEVVVE
jgi:plastocyanin